MAASVVLMLVLIITVMLLAIVNQFNEVSKSAEARQLNDLQKTLQARINDTSEAALQSIDSIVSAPGVAEAFSKHDRDTLRDLTLPVFKNLQSKHNVQQFQFHLPPATSFLRLHKLEKFGDDLSSFRFTVVRANQHNQAQFGLEKGVAGIGLRGVIPVAYQNQHIGSAEVGLSFGQDFFDTFTKRYDAPAALYIADTSSASGFSTFATTVPGGTSTLTKERFQAALLNNETSFSNIIIGGRPYSALISPVTDFSGKPLAVAEILVDRSQYVSLYNSTLLKIIIIGIVALLAGLVLALLLSRSITKPIEHLTESAVEVSRGNFDIAISGTQRKDEIGSLAKAVSRMAESIKLAMERLTKSP